jgi:hypothetical protein
MSTPVRGPESPLSYAPRWARSPEGAGGNGSEHASGLAAGHAQRPREAELREEAPAFEEAPQALPAEPPWKRRKSSAIFEGDVAIKELRARLALTPDHIPEPTQHRAGAPVFAIVGRLLGVMVLVAAGVAIVWIVVPHVVPQTQSVGQVVASRVSQIVASQQVGATQAPPAEPEPIRAELTRPEPFKAELFKAVKTERIVIDNRKGDREPAPTPAPSPGADPPRSAADGPGAPPAVPAPRVVFPATETRIAPPAAAPPLNSPAAADREETATLLARGRAHVADGDLAAARLVLRRAVERGDSQAALALGGTYDPNVLRRLGVVSFAGDPEQARDWYRKAAELGSTDAPLRLEQLAQVGR